MIQMTITWFLQTLHGALHGSIWNSMMTLGYHNEWLKREKYDSCSPLKNEAALQNMPQPEVCFIAFGEVLVASHFDGWR